MKHTFFRFSIGLLFVCTILLPSESDAASLYIDPAINTLNRGDSITMSVRLDVDENTEECVNAVDGVITYTANIIPVDISTGDSIFNIWVERPKIDKEKRTITFAGGIPNGYCGRVDGDPRLTNVLTQIIFMSPGFAIGGSDDTTAIIEFTDESTAYLNDGLGTKANLNIYPAKIELSPSAGPSQVNPWKDEVEADKIQPTQFSISLQKDETAFSQKYYIVFNTTDKETGIDHYEVMEESLTQAGTFQWGRADAPWIPAVSPYVLDDQSLNSIIRVKAIDKAGNEYVATLVPDDSMQSLSLSFMMTLIFGFVLLMGLALVAFTVVTYIKRRRQESSNEIKSDTDLPNTKNDYEN